MLSLSDMIRHATVAARIASDLEAMLGDGEFERAAYCFDDLRAELGATPQVDAHLARELDLLEAALSQSKLPTAQDATRRLVALLGAR